MWLRQKTAWVCVLVLSAASVATAQTECTALPVAEDDALVFAPNSDAVLRVDVVNPTGDDLRLVAAVRDFRGVAVPGAAVKKARDSGQTVIAYGVRKYFRVETLSEKTVGQGAVPVKAGHKGEVTIPLGKMPEGFYMVDLTFQRGEATVANHKYPLGVFKPPADPELTPPDFLVGVYPQYMQYRRKTPPIFWKTYIHAIANDLRAHRVNAFRACAAFDEGELEIYNRYGIVGISQNGRKLDHPGVFATFVSDEPKPGKEMEELKAIYATLRQKSDKVITTCMVGEGMGLTTPGDPVNLWKQLQPKVRLFRWYGVKKHFYDVLHPVHYKGNLPFTSVLRIAEVSYDTPWWIILPAFGGDQHEAYFQNPSPGQLRCMSHLAVAYGADGLIYFRYQNGLVDPVTLKPRDGKLAVVAEVAGRVQKHAGTLKTLQHVGLDIRCPDPVVEAVPVRWGERLAVYAVNKDPKNAVSTRLMLWDEVWHWTVAQDVYAGKKMEVTRADDGYLFVPLALGPGEGKVIVTDAKVDK